jgi:transcriptional regulator with XRE-family HTH domain
MTEAIHRNSSADQIPLVAALPPGTAVLPDDFPLRLLHIKMASGLSWNALAEKLGVDPRQMSRWRKGVEPSGGAMLALVKLSMLVPDGVQVLLGGNGALAPGRRGEALSNSRRPY